MKALLLSAGYGTRLRPITNHIPKCLVDIHGKPLLQLWLEMLSFGGVNDILVNTHYLAEKVKSFLEQEENKLTIKIVYEEKLLGTGGTLLKNRVFFDNEPVILIHADNLSKFDMAAFIRRHETRPEGTEMTMMTFHTDVPKTCGIVELDENDVLTAFHEKVEHPPGNLANGAVYILEPGVFDFLENTGKELIDFSNDVIPNYMGRIYTFENKVYHRDIGTIESYEAALKEFPPKSQII